MPRPRDPVRLAARVLFVVGCIAAVFAVASFVAQVLPTIRPAVPGGIAAPPAVQWLPALTILLLPVAPFAAWATLTVLCDIRDELRVEDE